MVFVSEAVLSARALFAKSGEAMSAKSVIMVIATAKGLKDERSMFYREMFSRLRNPANSALTTAISLDTSGNAL